MSKEKEIEKLKLQGSSIKEIINKGYKRSTVYKVFSSRLKPSPFIKDYQITGLKQVHNMIEMSLQPYHPPPSPEEIEEAQADAEHPLEEKAAQSIHPIPETDEGKIVAAYLDAYKKQAPELFGTLKEILLPHSKGMVIGPVQLEMNQQLYLTIDQYTALGSPPLLATITLKAEVKLNG